MCVRAFSIRKERLSTALWGTSEKGKSEGFFFGSRHTQGDKLGVSLGRVLGATTTES